MNKLDFRIQRWKDSQSAARFSHTAFQREKKTRRIRQGTLTSRQAPVARRVRLEFVHSKARRVNITGSFNDWRPGSTWMIAVSAGTWVKDLMLPPGRYEYRFEVDGCRPGQTADSDTQQNPIGDRTRVLWVPQPPNGASKSYHVVLRPGNARVAGSFCEQNLSH